MLHVDGLTCRFGAKAAVDKVSFSIEPGAFVGVIGRSGAGKSTLLRMINRLVEPSAGQIRFGDVDVSALRGQALRQWRARSAMIFQQFNLVGRLDVLTNVLMGRLATVPTWRSLAQIWPEADVAAALSALEQFDMAGFAAQRADQLSGGQQQRVAIARALVQEPEIILADEPIASLDPRSTRIVMDALLRINKHFGITVICNLHSLDLARTYCDRLIGLSAGRVVFDGLPATLTEATARELYDLEADEVMGLAAQTPPGSPFPPTPRRRADFLSPPFSRYRDLAIMIDRRLFLTAAAVALASPASAQSWKSKYPELTFAIIPAENASGVTERWTPFVDYLSRQLGVKVNLRIANDYAAVIEGQRSGFIQIASYGSASFARARITGVKTEAFANDINNDGSTGYYSVFYVNAKSPYKTIADLKGKNLGLVDPNSTSGNNVPRFELDKEGIPNAEAYFGKVIYAGSHENAVLALAQGTVDVAANQWTNDDDSTLAQMLRKNMLKQPDGTAMTKADFRIIHKSDIIPNGPYAYSTDLPDDLKAAIAKAFLEAPEKDKAAFDRLADGQRKGFKPETTKDWDATIELVKFVDRLRKKAS